MKRTQAAPWKYMFFQREKMKHSVKHDFIDHRISLVGRDPRGSLSALVYKVMTMGLKSISLYKKKRIREKAFLFCSLCKTEKRAALSNFKLNLDRMEKVVAL